MQDWKDFGLAKNVTRSLRIHWSSPFGGRRILVGPGPDSDAPWWGHARDRGTVPSQQDAQEYDGFLRTSSAGGRQFVSRFWFKTGMKIGISG